MLAAKISVLTGLFVLINMFLCSYSENNDQNRATLDEMISYLKLSPIVSSSNYVMQSYNIYNDTLVGYAPKLRQHYVRSLIDTSYSTFFRVPNTPSWGNMVDFFRNGCLYFQDADMIKRYCIDNQDVTYLGPFVPANALIPHGDLVIILAMDGVHIADLITDSILWHYKYNIMPTTGLHAILNNSLIILDPMVGSEMSSTKVVNVDLGTFETNYSMIIQGVRALPGDLELVNNGEDIIAIPTADSTYFTDVFSGQVISVTDFVMNPYTSKMIGDLAFANKGDTLISYNVRDGKFKWKIPALGMGFIHKNYIIGYQKDSVKIVDMKTGELRKSIPTQGDLPLISTTEEYVLIDSTIYK